MYSLGQGLPFSAILFDLVTLTLNFDLVFENLTDNVNWSELRRAMLSTDKSCFRERITRNLEFVKNKH